MTANLPFVIYIRTTCVEGKPDSSLLIGGRWIDYPKVRWAAKAKISSEINKAHFVPQVN